MTKRKKTMNTSEAMEIIIKEHGDRVTVSDVEELELVFAEIEAFYGDDSGVVVKAQCNLYLAMYGSMNLAKERRK
jgi:hypothetical protein